jgi:bacillithiol biosynthesis deacetylase BshB1
VKLDVLIFGAHPDDVELSCGGTILKLVNKGLKIGIVDLTTGEMGTRGTPAIRLQESQKAAELLGLSMRMNLEMEDALFELSQVNLLKVAAVLRAYQPDIVIANAPEDRHNDHRRAAQLVKEAYFLAGLYKLSLQFKGKEVDAWRPKALFNYIQDYYLNPSFCVDITAFQEQKMRSVLAHQSQFFNPASQEQSTRISGEDFLKFIEGRAREMGRMIYTEFGEGFLSERPLDPKILAYFQ